MGDTKSHQGKINEESQQLLDFKEKVKRWPAKEIHKKVQLWIRRIEQFELLNSHTKARELYQEFKAMIEVLEEIAQQQKAKSLPPSVPTPGLVEAPFREIDLLNNSLSSFNMAEIVGLPNVSFKFYSDDNSLEQVYEIAQQKFERLPLTEIEKINLDAALREAIGNAQRHGHKYNPKLPIEFHYQQLPQRLVLRVKDQGEGFDYRTMLEKKKQTRAIDAARERYQEGGYGGLGIMLMLKCVDKLEYNDTGTELTLEKYFAAATTPH